MDFEMSHNPRVSVIVPVYNNEKYIRETLNSLKAQTFSDFEALCVDDGSSDNSSGIIQEFAATDQRFHYVFQENSGAGPARNNGLSKATGEFVSFLDGDDLYHPDYLKRMTEALDQTQADMCVCERETFDSKTGQILLKSAKYRDFEEGRVYQTGELVDGYYDLMTVFCWDKMFRHSFLQKYPYEFQNLRHCNDVAFVCSTISAAQSVCFVKERLLRYRTGTGVSTQDKATKHPLCALQAFEKARDNVLQLHQNDQAWQRTIDTRCAEAFFNTFQKNVKFEKSCREVYDAFHNQYEPEWKFREKPIRYFGNKIIRLKMWCYRRTSFDGMRKAYLKLNTERGKRNGLYDFVKSYGALVVSSLLKR